MPQYYVNTFNPQTPIGAGLQNLGVALFAGMQPRDPRQQASAEQALKHGELFSAQAAKTKAEEAILRRRLEMASPDAIDDLIAARAGVSVPRLRGYREEQRIPGSVWGAAGPPPPEELARIADALLTVQPAMGGVKEVDPRDLATAWRTNVGTRGMEAVMSGQQPAGRFAAAVAGAEGKPLMGMESGYQFPLHTAGGLTETPLAAARTRTEGSRQGELGARAGAANELAALRKRTDPNLRSAGAGANAVDIAIDDDPNSPTFEQEIYVRRPEAPGMRPGARPRAPGPEKAPRTPSGTTVTTMANTVKDALNAAKLVVEPDTERAIVSHAIQLLNDPGSEFAGDPIGAAQAATSEAVNVTGGRESQYLGFGRDRLTLPPRGAPGQRAAGAITGVPQPPPTGGKPIPTGGGAGLPPEAVARLKEGVATRFANGQVWTLQGGRPAQVQ